MGRYVNIQTYATKKELFLRKLQNLSLSETFNSSRLDKYYI